MGSIQRRRSGRRTCRKVQLQWGHMQLQGSAAPALHKPQGSRLTVPYGEADVSVRDLLHIEACRKGGNELR